VSALPRARVLIVDDDTDTVDTLVTLLEQDGHACAAAYNGAGAIRACEADAFDCMVLDHWLGEVNGLEVARHFLDSPLRPNRIILLTGDPRDDFETALDDGLVDDHVQKPAEPAALVLRVRRSLQAAD
jgi:CheY-like chemotaxis protein